MQGRPQFADGSPVGLVDFKEFLFEHRPLPTAAATFDRQPVFSIHEVFGLLPALPDRQRPRFISRSLPCQDIAALLIWSVPICSVIDAVDGLQLVNSAAASIIRVDRVRFAVGIFRKPHTSSSINVV